MIINQVVSGGGSAPAHYIEKTVDANGKLVNGSTNFIDLTGVTDVGERVLSGAYYKNTNLTGNINLGSLTKVSGANSFSTCFQGCTGITSVDCSNIETISGASAFASAFMNCTGLTSANFSSLKRVSNNLGFGSCFNGCSSLTTINFSNLEVVDGQCFQSGFNNTAVVSADFPKLTTVTGNQPLYSAFANDRALTSVNLSSLKKISSAYALSSMFSSAHALTEISFPALTSTSFGTYTNQFSGMLSTVTGCTVHFPSNLQSVIGSWSDVTNGFSGTNTTVLFDLPATVILTGANSVEYERSPKDDTQTSLAWRVKDTGTDTNPTIDWTPFYTSGTSDPSVGATIYSDSACTTAVTTISAIA